MNKSTPQLPSSRKPSGLHNLIWGVAAVVGVFFLAIPALMENTLGTKLREIQQSLGSQIRFPGSLLLGVSSLYSSALGIVAVITVGALLTGGFLLMPGRRSRIGYFVGLGGLLLLWAAVFFFGIPFVAMLLAEPTHR